MILSKFVSGYAILSLITFLISLRITVYLLKNKKKMKWVKRWFLRLLNVFIIFMFLGSVLLLIDPVEPSTSSNIQTTKVKVEVPIYETLVGDKDENFYDLNYKLNSKLNFESVENKCFLSSEKGIPYVQFSLLDNEQDVHELEQDKLKDEVMNSEVNLWSKDDQITNEEFKQDDSIYDYFYEVNIKDKSQFSSNKISVHSKVIPTYSGLYKASIYTYSKDKNDYLFDEWTQSFNINKLLEDTLKVKEKKIEDEKKAEEERKLKEHYVALKTEIENIKCNSSANIQESQIFEIRKQNTLNLIESRALDDEIASSKDELLQTNKDIENRLELERQAEEARQAEEQRQLEAQRQAEAARAAQAQQSSSNNQNSYSSSSSQNDTIRGGYYCVDGTYVGNANPHAKGRANACYGHGGFQVNH